MKTKKDTTIKAKDPIARGKASHPTPATTPEMIDHYRQHLTLCHSQTDYLLGSAFTPFGACLTADPGTDPFIIRFTNPIRPQTPVAYLTVRNGRIEWRFHRLSVRYARCPIVREPVLMQLLDGLFADFYIDAELPDSLIGAVEMLGPWDRMRWVRTNLFEGGRPEETLSEEIDSWVYSLNWMGSPEQFLSWISDALYSDKNQFRYSIFQEDDPEHVFYLLRYSKREATAFMTGQQQPVLYLAAVLNSILQPDYELRRFRDKKLGKDGILMPMTPKDWETLSGIYGPMAIEARFSPIHGHVKTTKGRRPTMDP